MKGTVVGFTEAFCLGPPVGAPCGTSACWVRQQGTGLDLFTVCADSAT